jgi:NitT/TauT family transport system ATP-binding protein
MSIELRKVSRCFQDVKGKERVVLKGVSLALEKKSFTCLLGPSGCGKTTLMHLVAGFDKPSSGTVHVDGAPVLGPHPSRSVIFQDYGLFPWRTALGNVLFALEAKGEHGKGARATAMRYLELVGLGHAAHQHPHQLSGGMRQRVALARALAALPDILLMDEPFAALDTFTRFRLQDELLRLWNEKQPTVIFVTHDIDEAVYLAERVLVMAPGPGRITHDISIDLPRPCDRTHPLFLEARGQIFQALSLAHKDTVEYEI